MAKTQKTTKVTDEERVAALPEIKREIRQTDPNLSAQEVERRALRAVGLPTGEDVDPDSVDLRNRREKAADATRAGASKAASRGKSAVTSSGARKMIAGVLFLSLGLGVIRDIRSGAAITTDVIPRRIVGTFFAAILLMMLAGPMPGVARGLSFLVGFTVVGLNQETISAIAGSVTDEAVDAEGGTGAVPPEITPGQPS